MDQPKLQRLLEMMTFLSSGLKYTIAQIAQRFDTSERTAERYIQTFRDAGFIIPKPKDGLYYIDKGSPYFKEISELLHFSKEEAVILQKAIHSIDNENLLKQNLVSKLYALYDFDRVADTIVRQEQSVIIHNLIYAIKTKQKVVLKGYLSANSNNKTDRIIEPFDFTSNYIATWAYEPETGKCKTFKNTRVNSVVLLNEPWINEEKHHKPPIDVFRMSGQNQIPVKLRLSIRACELLIEEYPLSEEFITKVDDPCFEFEASVCGFEGIGRFIMGLCDEISVIYPTELKDFLKKRASQFINDRS